MPCDIVAKKVAGTRANLTTSQRACAGRLGALKISAPPLRHFQLVNFWAGEFYLIFSASRSYETGPLTGKRAADFQCVVPAQARWEVGSIPTRARPSYSHFGKSVNFSLDFLIASLYNAATPTDPGILLLLFLVPSGCWCIV